MATSRTLKPVTDEDEQEFATKVVTVRGVEYTLQELDGDTYDECVELATVEDSKIKFDTLYRAMLERSLVSPKMKITEINKKPMGVRTALIDAVTDLHWPVAPPSKDGEKGKG